jgi:hypothetical protein
MLLSVVVELRPAMAKSLGSAVPDLRVPNRRQRLTKSLQRRDRVAGKQSRLPEPLHAIDEPATPAPPLHHAFPYIGAAQHADGIEATQCGMRHREALLLADCWQSWPGATGIPPGVGWPP